MATVLNTLYPPLIDTFMPAFPRDECAVVNFTVSPYNSSYLIHYLHVTLVNQKTNQNVLKNINRVNNTDSAIVNGIWIIPFKETPNLLTMDREANFYTLKIPTSVLKNNSTSNSTTTSNTFLTDCYYKLQIRFDSTVISTESTTNNGTPFDSTYLASNRAYFSEWSSVCLLKAIPTITVHLNNYTQELDDYLNSNPNAVTNKESDIQVPQRKPQYVPGVIPFAGNLTFEKATSAKQNGVTEYFRKDIKTSSYSEYLSSYQITITDPTGEIIRDSKVQYPSKAEKTNNFYWLCDMTDCPTGQTYTVTLYFTTNNQYKFSKTFKFTLVEPIVEYFKPVFNFKKTVLPEHGIYKDYLVTSEDGWVEFTVTSSNSGSPGYLFIKRATSLDNYKEWELIDCSYVSNAAAMSRTIVDKTVGSLVRYKYACQFLTIKGNWSATYFSNEVVYPDFHDILISRGDKQLAVRYNAQIASMTPVVNRVKIDTLGGRYPKFAENAKLHYKQFQLSGMIVAESDYNRTFLSDLNYADEMKDYNDQIGGRYGIRNDTIREPDTIKVVNEEGHVTYNNYGTYTANIDKADTDTRQHMRDTQQNTYHDIYPINNWWWEREFRKEVVEWLNDGEPKLYRSMTEGNLIVMLDGISLTPNSQLGRRIWNFSCTVYEVGDGYSLDELDALGVYPVFNEYQSLYNVEDSPTPTDLSNGELGTIEETFLGQSYRVRAFDGNIATRIVHPTTYLERQTYPGYELKLNTANEWVATDRAYLSNEIGSWYGSGFQETFVLKSESIRLRDVKIQFESLPQWYNLESFSPERAANRNMSFINVTLNNGDSKMIYFTYNPNTKKYIFSDYTTPDPISVNSIDELVSTWELQWDIISGNTVGNDLMKIDVGDVINSAYLYSYTDSNLRITHSEILPLPQEGQEINENKVNISELVHQTVSGLVAKKVEEDVKRNYGLGYKLRLILSSPWPNGNEFTRTIFVNEKGYYQVPSNIIVKDIELFDGAEATLDYIVDYELKYQDVTEPNSYEVSDTIIGQISGEWDYTTALGPIINSKYYAKDQQDDTQNDISIVTTQEVTSWKAMTYDGTPYTILYLTTERDGSPQRYIVSRSGVLSLQTDFPLYDITVAGKRMVQAPISRQPYLDEWEFVLDDSIYSSAADPNENNYGQYWWILWEDTEEDTLVPVIVYLDSNKFDETTQWSVVNQWYTIGDTSYFDKTEILEPMPNTVYGIINPAGGIDYKIYYLDYGWFNIEFPNIKENDFSIAYARVPVYGMVDYSATILKKVWEYPLVTP